MTEHHGGLCCVPCIGVRFPWRALELIISKGPRSSYSDRGSRCFEQPGSSANLEAAGIPTVVIGSARDIVEECGVARFVYTDFPLGNPCGKPYDAEMQCEITSCALDLLDTAVMARTSVQTPYVWDEDASWKDRYARVDAAEAAKLKAAGDARRARQAAKQEGRS